MTVPTRQWHTGCQLLLKEHIASSMYVMTEHQGSKVCKMCSARSYTHTMLCRVYQSKQHEPLSLGHMTRCLVGTGMQALNCWLAAKVLIRAFKSWSPGVMYLAKRFPALQVTQ